MRPPKPSPFQFLLFREKHALRPSPALSAARCTAASEARKAAEKHFYIDAFRDKNDTRETLLRYTFKSHSVNLLIRGNLWNSTRRANMPAARWPELPFSPLGRRLRPV
jgi:hypothetical protein